MGQVPQTQKQPRKKSGVGELKKVRCLGEKHDWDKPFYFLGSSGHRFCPACTSRREREPNPPRAATSARNVLYDDL